MSTVAEQPDAPIVDAHHHVWSLDDVPQPWIREDMSAIRRDFSIEDYRADTAGSHVTRSIIVQTVASFRETLGLLRLSSTNDVVRGVIGWVDLTDADVAGAIVQLRESAGGERLVGIRALVESEPDPGWLLRPDVQRGLQSVAAAGLVFDLLVTPPQLAAAAQVAELVPDLYLVLDHLGKPPLATGDLHGWSADLRSLATHHNVVAKLSGLVTEASWAEWTAADLEPAVTVALEAFGPDRLLFGSDWPVCRLAADYSTVVDSARYLLRTLAPAERQRVLSDNASAVYSLT